MRRLLMLCGIMVGLLVTVLGFFQVSLQETVLPLGSTNVGFINFQPANIPPAVLDSELQTISTQQQVEIFQLSGTTGVKNIDIIVRGTPQPLSISTINWFNPELTGNLIPAHLATDTPHSGIYALKGNQLGIEAVQKWLTAQGAVNTWENYGFIQLLLLPLVYQGIISAILVVILLAIIIVIGWLISRRRSQMVRMIGGHSNWQIIYTETTTILYVTALSSLITVGIGLIIIKIWRGSMFAVIPVELILLIFSWCCIGIFSIFASILTKLSIKEYVKRVKIPFWFSIITNSLRGLVIILIFATLSFTYFSAHNAKINMVAAHKVAELPSLYSVNFGGIVDESRDWDPQVTKFNDFIAKLNQTNSVYYANLIPVDEQLDNIDKVKSVVVYNSATFNLLNSVANSQNATAITSTGIEKFIELTSTEAKPILEIAGIEENYLAKARVFLPIDYNLIDPIIAVWSTGLFQVAPTPAIVVVEQIDKAFSADKIMTDASRGAVLFKENKDILSSTSALGLNLTVDSVQDKNALYAADQRLAYNTARFSMFMLLCAFGVSTYIAALLYANSKKRALFPHYTNGESFWKLLKLPLTLDAFWLLSALFVSHLITRLMFADPLLIRIFITGVLLTVSYLIYKYFLRRSMRAIVARRDD